MLSAPPSDAMPAKRLRILVGLASLCFCALYQLGVSEPLFYVQLNNVYRDALARAGRLTPANPDLVFLAIDADSVSLDPDTDAPEMYGINDANGPEARAFSFMMRRYPWPREVYALVLQRLVDAGAKVVMFDLTFPSETEGDTPFRLALDRYRDHVVIGSNFVNPIRNQDDMVAASLSRPAQSLIPPTSPLDDRVAFTNFWPDVDNVVRRVPYRVTAEQVQNENPRPDSERFLSLAARAAIKAGFAQVIPSDVRPRAFRFTGPPGKTFPPHSIFEIFVPDYWKHNYQEGRFFRGKTVVIGAHGAWQHDEHETPFGSMPGPELHLNALNAALHHEFINESTPAMGTLLTALAAILAVGLSIFLRSPWIRLLSLGAANALVAWIALLAFNRASLYLPLVCPCAQLNFAVLLGLVSDFTLERIEKHRVRRTLERYVSRDVVAEMLDRPQAYEQSLGGVTRPVTILFSDIRSYSAVTARREPHLLVQQLNEYLTAMVQCVFQCGGTLDKFVGDAVMAVWGNIQSRGPAEDARNAVRAARDMQQELVRLNQIWKERGWPELRAGIAVHHGEVVVGNIGSPQRMEFTVIGDAVNLTWKLQELTKEISCPFIMSEQVQALVHAAFDLQPLGAASLPFLQRPIRIFTFAESAVSLPAPKLSHAGVLAETGSSVESPAAR
jgi:adenylate cyclase